MFLDKTYFVGDLAVPNLFGTAVVNTAIAEEVANFIRKYELDYLYALLGKTLADELIAGMLVLPTPDTKWSDLYNQIYFTRSSITWNEDHELEVDEHGNIIFESIPLSPAANFVFFKFYKSHITEFFGSGESKPAKENAATATSSARMIQAWNVCCDMTYVIWKWLDDNSATYDWDWTSAMLEQQENGYTGYYPNFLQGRYANSPAIKKSNLPYNPFEKLNAWGI